MGGSSRAVNAIVNTSQLRVRVTALGLLLLPMVFPSRLRPESGSGWTGESCQQVTLNLSLPVMEP